MAQAARGTTAALEQCRHEQQLAQTKLQRTDLTAMERYLASLWLEDWVKEEVYLTKQVATGSGYPLTNALTNTQQMRLFETGATRNVDEDKLDYEGFLSPLVLKRYAEYMHRNRLQADGQLRASDNWTKGIPRKAYIKSLYRHFTDVWLISRGYTDKATVQDMEEALCAVLFNGMGLLHEYLVGRSVGDPTT